ncbi:MAG: mobile mystery protein A [Gammaproteobacteria bacterium]|nr:mobile mystery protein A [Gammaproteobacteria bacterium]MBL7005009.1 mobile mystery protein A [Gammaproteobacteria bacterium]
MSVKQIVLNQYQEIVDRAQERVKNLTAPNEGWLRSVRKALSMSGVQLASRLGVTKASVFNTEKAELSGGVTLKKMEQMAQGMGCRFVYFVIPEKPVKDILSDRAKIKAEKIVTQASYQMALEAQALSNKQLRFEVDRLQQEILRESPSDLWNDK